MTVFRHKDTEPSVQEGFLPAGKIPLLAFLSGVLALVLVAGWLSRLVS